MKNLTITLFLSALLFFSATAQDTAYEGLVNTDYKVRLTLKIQDETVTGTCANTKMGKVNTISGTVDGSDLVLVEKNESGEELGFYTGSIISGYMFKGDWSKTKDGETQTFILTKVEGDDITPVNEFLGKSVKGKKTIKANNTPYDKGNIGRVLQEFKNCKAANAKNAKCKELTAKAICMQYGISDFVTSQDLESYVSIDDIPDFVKKHESWRKLGVATDKEVVAKVMEHLLLGKAAIAFNTLDNYTHVAVLLPGEGAKSGSWGTTVPNAASFFGWSPQKSFLDSTLNYVFAKPSGIEIWVRD